MTATTLASAEEMGCITSSMFELLWGHERGPIPTTVDHAYEMIWKQLVSGERKPGERLTDTELASQLGVSRTPVRQALQRLVQDELVDADPRRGFRVRTFTVHDIHEIYDVRSSLEVLALRLAAPNLRAKDLDAQLNQLCQVRARLQEQPVALFLQNDLRLHNLLVCASGNRRLFRLLASLRSQHGMFQVRDTSYPDRIRIALDDHERILLALIGGQTGQAAELLAQHITKAKNGVLADIFDVREVMS